jgi:hypothetical protein
MPKWLYWKFDSSGRHYYSLNFKVMKKINFAKITLRKEISSRGGGIEISLDTLGFKGVRMTAYQNYLGGGMLGGVANNCTIRDWETEPKLVEIAEQLKEYYFNLTNPDEGWERVSFEQNQSMPTSAY